MTLRPTLTAAALLAVLGLAACKDNGTVETQPGAGSAATQTLTQSQQSSASDGSGGDAHAGH
ncbi:hypothetical protein [uncultured Aureimonas sp.]|uniref:hypothetical protein n=1 Tax=uncultured Aureimonas sp. TaxID=1604662 RepID=UPI0025E8C848|nr:hypothetical protein [uncultured Aureimonas sp.]